MVNQASTEKAVRLHPLAKNTRVKLLRDMLRRAEAGDIEAAATLIWLSMGLERELSLPAMDAARP